MVVEVDWLRGGDSEVLQNAAQGYKPGFVYGMAATQTRMIRYLEVTRLGGVGGRP